jgi:predicted heme/steroid binding protein
MKTTLIGQILVGTSILFGGIATPIIQNIQEQQLTGSSSNWLQLTLAELAIYDGQNGQLAYIAYDGDIYDVTDASGWNNGVHEGLHLAGTDCTSVLQSSPHGTSVLIQLTIIGQLVDANGSSSSTLPNSSSSSTTVSEVCIWIEEDDAIRFSDDDEDEDYEYEDEEDEDDDYDDEDEDEDDDGYWSCSNTTTTSLTPGSSITLPNTPSTDGMYYLNLSELAYYDGTNGKPAWIAVYGKIYNVTNETAWRNGVHRGIAMGGTDATAFFESSPHSLSILNTMSHVGWLIA